MRGQKTQGIFKWNLVDTATQRQGKYEDIDVEHEVSDAYRGKFIPREVILTSSSSGETEPYAQVFRSYQDYSRYLYRSLGLEEEAWIDTTGAFVLDPRLDRVMTELEENYIGMTEQKFTLYDLKLNANKVFGHLPLDNFYSNDEPEEGVLYVSRESISDSFRRAVIDLPDPPADFKSGEAFPTSVIQPGELWDETMEATPGNTPMDTNVNDFLDSTPFSGPREFPESVRPFRDDDLTVDMSDNGPSPFDFAMGSRTRWELLLLRHTLANLTRPELEPSIPSLLATVQGLLDEQDSLVGRTIYAIPAGAYNMGEIAEQMKSIQEKMKAIEEAKEELSGSGLLADGDEETKAKVAVSAAEKKAAAKKKLEAARERVLVQQWDKAHWEKREAELLREATEFVRAYDKFKNDYLRVFSDVPEAMGWKKYMVPVVADAGGIFSRIERTFGGFVQHDDVLRFLSSGTSRHIRDILHALRRLQKKAAKGGDAPNPELTTQMERLGPLVEDQATLAGQVWFAKTLPDAALEMAEFLSIFPRNPIDEIKNATRLQSDSYKAFFEDPTGQLWSAEFADELRSEMVKLPAIKAKLQATRNIERTKEKKALAKAAAKHKAAMQAENKKRRAAEKAQYGEKAMREREAKKDVKKAAQAAAEKEEAGRDRRAREVEYYHLIKTYGTHFVEGATFGGKIEMTTLIDKKHFKDEPLWEMENEMKKSMLEHELQRTMLLQLRTGSSDFRMLRMLGKQDGRMNSNVVFKGGDVSAPTESLTLKGWKRSLQKDPTAIDFQLVPISELVRPFVSEHLNLCERGQLPPEEEAEAAAEAGVDGPSTEEPELVVGGAGAGGVDPNAFPISDEEEQEASAASSDDSEPEDADVAPPAEQEAEAEKSDADAEAASTDELTPEAKAALKREKEAEAEVAAEAKTAEAKADALKAEAPKAEAPKAEAPKAEAPKAEAPKAEAPKAEAPKAEAPKAEAPKAEAPTPEADAPKADAPKADAPKADAPKADAPTPEADAPTPEADAPTPEADAPTPEADAPTPEADAPTPEGETEERFRGVSASLKPASGVMCIDKCTQRDLTEQQNCLESCMSRVNRRIRKLEDEHVLHARAMEQPDVFLAQATRVSDDSSVNEQSCSANCLRSSDVDAATACLSRCMEAVQSEIARLHEERDFALQVGGQSSFLQLSSKARSTLRREDDADEYDGEVEEEERDDDDESSDASYTVSERDYKTLPPGPLTKPALDRTVDDTDGSAWQCMNTTQRLESLELFAQKRAFLDFVLAKQHEAARGLDTIRIKISVVVREQEFYEAKTKAEIAHTSRSLVGPSLDLSPDGSFMFHSEMWLQKCMELYRLRYMFQMSMATVFPERVSQHDRPADVHRDMLMKCDNDYFQVFAHKPPGIRMAYTKAPLSPNPRLVAEGTDNSEQCDFCKAVFKRAQQLKNPATRGRVLKPSTSLVKQAAWKNGCKVIGNLTDFNKNPWQGWAVFGFVQPKQLCYHVAGHVDGCVDWVKSHLRNPMCQYSEFRFTRAQARRSALVSAYDNGCPSTLSFSDPQALEDNCDFISACKCAGFCPMDINERCYLSSAARFTRHLVPDPRTPAVSDQCFGVGIFESTFYRRTSRSFFPKWVKRWFILDKFQGTITEYLFAGPPRDPLMQPLNEYSLEHFDGSIGMGKTGYLQLGLTKEGQKEYEMPNFIIDIPGEKNTRPWRNMIGDWAAHFACAMKHAKRPLVQLENVADAVAELRLEAYTAAADIA